MHSHKDLQEPVQNHFFWDNCIVFLESFDMEAKFAVLAIFHNDDDMVIVGETLFELHNIGMAQVL